MRQLLAAIVTIGLAIGVASTALASGRAPTGIKQISVLLTFPPQSGSSRPAVRRTLTRASSVREVVNSVDGLQTASTRGVCPMLVRLAPELTVTFRGGSSDSVLAQARVQVALGAHGTSGSSACSPIHFTAGGVSHALVGNSFVRLVGRLVGTSIS